MGRSDAVEIRLSAVEAALNAQLACRRAVPVRLRLWRRNWDGLAPWRHLD
jgi:hypothetical protein